MRLLLGNALVVHGDPAVAPRPADVVVEDGRISAIENPGVLSALQDRGWRPDEVIDLEGRALLPGLIDCHVHLVYTEGPNASALFEGESIERRTIRTAIHARQHLEAGVTTVRDLGDSEPTVFVVRDAIRDGLIPGPRIVASGLVITTTGGHGHDLGVEADTAEEVLAGIRGRIAAGADCIKVIASGGVHTKGSSLMDAQYTADQLRPGVAAAHEAGRTVGAHASNPAGMSAAILSGCDSIEHGVLLDDATAARMAEHGTWFVPTLVATQLYEPHADHPSIPPHVREKAAITVPAHRENFPRAVRAGVRLVTGTDAGSSFIGHGLVAEEVAYLVRFGVTAAEAIAAATLNAASLLRLDGEIGSIELGKVADLLAVDGDPLADVGVLRRPWLVLAGGRVAARRDA